MSLMVQRLQTGHSMLMAAAIEIFLSFCGSMIRRRITRRRRYQAGYPMPRTLNSVNDLARATLGRKWIRRGEGPRTKGAVVGVASRGCTIVQVVGVV